MKSKYLGIVSATAAGVLSAALVLGGLASVSSAASGGPTVVLTSAAASSTSSASIPVTATFSEDVGGFASSSVTATNATVGAVSGSGSTYSFTLTATAEGEVTVTIPADIASSTASSTGNQMSNTLTLMYDATSPVIAEVTGIASTTASSSPTYTFSSTEAGTMDLSGTGCTMMASSTAAVSGNNTITFDSLADGSYHCSLSVADAAGNSSNTLHIDFEVDTAPAPAAPVLSDIMVSAISTTSATISWSTDASSTGQVFYGTSSSYGSMSALNASSSTSHSVAISGLSEATLYHFKVVSTNAGGTATSSDMTFVTQSTASSTPLLVTRVDTVRGNATADGTFANGWEWILHFVIPDNEMHFAMKFADFANTTNSSTTIPTANNIRVWTPQSSNASTTASAMVETDNGYSGDIMLSGDTSTTTPGRQVDVHVEVAIPSGTPTGSYTTTFGAMSTTTAF